MIEPSEQIKELLPQYPLVKQIVDKMKQGDPDRDEWTLVQRISLRFDSMGPYHYGKQQGVLIDGSAEEFAVQWMGFWNCFHPDGY